MGSGASGCQGSLNQGNGRQIYAGPPINFRVPCGPQAIETLTASVNGCSKVLVPIGTIERLGCGLPNMHLLI